MCFELLYNIYLKYFRFQEEFSKILEVFLGLHIKYHYSCHIFTKLKFPRQISEKKARIAILITILPVGAVLTQADPQRDEQSLFDILLTRLKTDRSKENVEARKRRKKINENKKEATK